jgi:hypothetical protein
MSAACALTTATFMQPRPVEPQLPKVSTRLYALWLADPDKDGQRVSPLVCELYKALARSHPRAVSTDFLIERLWNGRPPSGSKSVLHNLASDLRTVLSRWDWTVINEDGFVGGPNGYRLKYQPSSEGMVRR